MVTIMEREQHRARKQVREFMNRLVKLRQGETMSLYPLIHRIVVDTGNVLSHQTVLREVKEYENSHLVRLEIEDNDKKAHKIEILKEDGKSGIEE